jgi:hypothetical protein
MGVKVIGLNHLKGDDASSISSETPTISGSTLLTVHTPRIPIQGTATKKNNFYSLIV